MTSLTACDDILTSLTACDDINSIKQSAQKNKKPSHGRTNWRGLFCNLVGAHLHHVQSHEPSVPANCSLTAKSMHLLFCYLIQSDCSTKIERRRNFIQYSIVFAPTRKLCFFLNIIIAAFIPPIHLHHLYNCKIKFAQNMPLTHHTICAVFYQRKKGRKSRQVRYLLNGQRSDKEVGCC